MWLGSSSWIADPAVVLLLALGIDALAGEMRLLLRYVSHPVVAIGKLVAFFDRRLNREPASRTSGLWIEDRGVRVPSRLIEAGPRVGVTYAGPVWAAKPWRFRIDPRAVRPPGPAPRRD